MKSGTKYSLHHIILISIVDCFLNYSNCCFVQLTVQKPEKFKIISTKKKIPDIIWSETLGPQESIYFLNKKLVVDDQNSLWSIFSQLHDYLPHRCSFKWYISQKGDKRQQVSSFKMAQGNWCMKWSSAISWSMINILTISWDKKIYI